MIVMPAYTVSMVDDDASLLSLWPAWEALWQRVPRAWPFLAPAWLRPWWNAFGTGRPAVAVLYGASGLAGLLPFYQLDKKLLPMGVGISDAFDALLAPEAPAHAASMLLSAALGGVPVPHCDIPELPPEAAVLSAAAPEGWHAETWHGSVCPVLSLSPEPAIPKGMRRDLRQARHRAERAGGYSLERATIETWPALFDALVRLHGKRWVRRGEAGVLADPTVLAFHRAVVPRLLDAGLLRLEAVYLRGQVAAAIYALVAADRICFYLSGFDPHAGYESPGTLLLGHMIETAAAEGRAEAHFLRGGEAYKYAWGGVDRVNTGRGFTCL